MGVEWMLTGILAILWAGVMSALLWRKNMQIRHMIKELQMKEETETGILLDCTSSVGDIRELTETINRVLRKKQETEEAHRREAHSYRESITSISHDIRTPLTSAKGYVQLMGDAAVTEEKRREYAAIVGHRLDALTELLDQLFLYARVQAGELSFEQTRVNAGNLFAETVTMFYGEFEKKGCEPELLLPERPCLITGDRSAFARVVENLVKNALAHGSGDYRFSLRQTGARVILRVSNRTDSITPGDMERIFDRFYTTDISRTMKHTGLGLSIVKEFTEQMGGEVRAGLEGDCFWIEAEFPGCRGSETKT